MELHPDDLALLLRHAASAPDEVCGVLLGRSAPRLRLEAIVAGRNVHPQPRAHFLLDAATLLVADRQARAAGQAIIGFYHSHPGGQPLPSAADRRDAWPGYLYLIVAVPQRALTAWLCAADGRLHPATIRPRPRAEARPDMA